MTKRLLLAVLLPALAAAAAPAPRKCASGADPRLSGDAFAPVECSTVTKPAPALPGVPADPKGGAPLTLKDLSGRWEGSVIHAIGRYELALTVTTHWGGKAELDLAMKEMQFHEKIADRLTLTPAKKSGGYDAVWTSDAATGPELKGRLTLGGTPLARAADLVFANGAAHRFAFAFKSKDELKVAVWSSIPGAPPQQLETVLRRAKP